MNKDRIYKIEIYKSDINKLKKGEELMCCQTSYFKLFIRLEMRVL